MHKNEFCFWVGATICILLLLLIHRINNAGVVENMPDGIATAPFFKMGTKKDTQAAWNNLKNDRQKLLKQLKKNKEWNFKKYTDKLGKPPYPMNEYPVLDNLFHYGQDDNQYNLIKNRPKLTKKHHLRLIKERLSGSSSDSSSDSDSDSESDYDEEEEIRRKRGCPPCTINKRVKSKLIRHLKNL